MAVTSLVVVDVHVVDDDTQFTLEELARACNTNSARLVALVEIGLVEPIGSEPSDWRFGGDALGRARTALRLAQDFDLTTDATALVVDLLDRIERLRARLRRAGLD